MCTWKNVPTTVLAHKTFSRFNTPHNPHMLIALVCTLLPNEMTGKKKVPFVWGIQLNSQRIKVKQVNDEKTF